MKKYTFEDALEHFMKDPEFAREYEKSRPAFELRAQIIHARIQMGLSQKQLGKMIGADRSTISKIEAGKSNPTLKTLLKLSKALKTDLVLKG